MADDRNPVDVATDLLVYAPVGLVVAVRELLPALVSRGRSEVGTQVNLAKVVGTMAARQGKGELGRAIDGARHQIGGVAEQVLRGLLSGTPPQPAPSPSAETSPPVRDPVPAPTAPTAAGPTSEGLAITDYDSLAASQVVTRLAGLTPGELEAVRAYEAAHRARRTILGRITQLQA